jgi:hypothetical protein
MLTPPAQSIEIDGKTKWAYTRHEPIGVCGQIIPWNYPIMMWSVRLPALGLHRPATHARQGVESRARARDGLHDRHEAVRADAPDGAGARPAPASRAC